MGANVWQVPALFLRVSEGLEPMSENSDILVSDDNVVISLYFV